MHAAAHNNKGLSDPLDPDFYVDCYKGRLINSIMQFFSFEAFRI